MLKANKIISIIMGAMLAMTANAEQEKGVIGRVSEDGAPVIYKFVNEFPPENARNQLPWLTVISWKYDGSSNNGMPVEAENQRMITLEDTIGDNVENDDVLRHVYSRTGNNLKELVYHIHGRDQFLEKFNQAVSGQPRYPIEINFYQDPEWKDFNKLLNDFSKSANK